MWKAKTSCVVNIRLPLMFTNLHLHFQWPYVSSISGFHVCWSYRSPTLCMLINLNQTKHTSVFFVWQVFVSLWTRASGSSIGRKWLKIVSYTFLIHSPDDPPWSSAHLSALENFVKTSNNILQSSSQLNWTVINILYQFYQSSIWKDFDSLNASAYVRDDKIYALQENSNLMIG